MSTAPGDSLRRYIFDRINVHRGSLDGNKCWVLAENISFLIRHAQGSTIDIDLNSISFTIVDVWNKERFPVGHKAAAIVHEAPGKKKVIVDAQAIWGHGVMAALTVKVDDMVVGLLDEK